MTVSRSDLLRLLGCDRLYPQRDPYPSPPASRVRVTGAGERRLVPDPATLLNSGSCRLRFPNLSVKNSRESRNHLEPGRNLVVD
jgi:hypothetical protein